MATGLQDGRLAQELRSPTGDNPPASEPTSTIHGSKHCHLSAKSPRIKKKMPRHRKTPQQPQKMTSYYASRGPQQNGGGARTDQGSGRNSGAEASAASSCLTNPPSEQSSGPSTPTTRSPAKSRQQRDSPVRSQADPAMEVSGPSSTTGQSIKGRDPITDFPTADRPVSDTLMKDMLLSLRSSLQTDLMRGITECQREVQTLGRRVNQVEHKMEEYTSSYNVMVEAHSAQGEDILWLKDKIADLEDRSRRNNLKMRGVPESVPPSQLLQFAQAFFSTLIPEATASDLLVDRIHRVPKPSFLPDDTPRDVLMRIHYYHIKDRILQVSRKQENIPQQYAAIRVLPDLSRHTLQRRRNLLTITKALRNHNILHKWKYPATLSITHNGQTISVSTLEEGLKALRNWGIISDQPAQHAQPQGLTPIQNEWQTVSYKRSSKKSNGGSS